MICCWKLTCVHFIKLLWFLLSLDTDAVNCSTLLGHVLGSSRLGMIQSFRVVRKSQLLTFNSGISRAGWKSHQLSCHCSCHYTPSLGLGFDSIALLGHHLASLGFSSWIGYCSISWTESLDCCCSRGFSGSYHHSFYAHGVQIYLEARLWMHSGLLWEEGRNYEDLRGFKSYLDWRFSVAHR